MTPRPRASTVPPLFMPMTSSGAEYTLLSQSCSSWIAGHTGRVRLAIGSALPEWSAWPCVTSITSQRSTCSGGHGLRGFAND